jgi:enoyl-CoA hydratase/carnithine racemase
LQARANPALAGEIAHAVSGAAVDVPYFLDVLPIEPPFARAQIEAQVTTQPEAARVLVELLRQVEKMKLKEALEAESLAYARLQGSAAHSHWLEKRSPTTPLPEGSVDMERAGDVLTLTLNRPWALNAIDRPMRDALREGFEVAAYDPELRQVRLVGMGKAFCIGADLNEFGTTCDPATAHAIRQETLPAHAIIRCADRFEAHVTGACIGAGLEMAAFAQRITATQNTWFQLPELAMGLIPGAGGCVSVSRRIGRERTAQAWGLIDAIVDD